MNYRITLRQRILLTLLPLLILLTVLGSAGVLLLHRLGGSILASVCRLELGDPRGVPAALEIGREPDAHDPQGQVLRDHALA